MDRYKRYMDGIEVPDTLHEKLTNLKAPQKRPNPWLKWGGLAAAVALVIGVGAWAVRADHIGRDVPGAQIDDMPGGWSAGEPEATAVPDIDIAEPIPDPNGGALTTADPAYGGGYEVRDGEVTQYFMLPALNWLDASGLEQSAADYVLAPPDAICRDAGYGEVTGLCGGEGAMRDHLLWDGLDWGGVLWFLEDGTPQAASVYADGENLFLSLEIMKGGKVPSCVVLPEEEYHRTEWRGVEITALKNTGYMVRDDGAELNVSREVSFVVDGVGYKLGLYTDDAKRAGELCARFVRYAVDGGFDLDAMSADGAAAPSALPDKGTPPPEMPTADIIHPGEEGYVEPLPEP